MVSQWQKFKADWIVNYSLPLPCYCMPIIANVEIARLKNLHAPVTIVNA